LDKWRVTVSHSWDKSSLPGTIPHLHRPKTNAFSWRRFVSIFISILLSRRHFTAVHSKKSIGESLTPPEREQIDR
jgi:hypothetical protein